MVQDHWWYQRQKKSWAVARPATVTLISLLQFAKAAILLLVAGATLANSGVHWSTSGLWQTIFVLTNGRVGPVYLAPLMAAYSYAVGVGLWSLKKWARKALMLSTALNALFWLLASGAGSAFQSSLTARLAMPAFSLQATYMLVYVDLFVLLALAWGRDVPEAFAQFS